MSDIILDANIIGDFLAQYFDSSGANRGKGTFCALGNISQELARRMNQILARFQRFDMGSEANPYKFGLIITSTFAFVELARKWDNISEFRFSIDQVYALLNQPPDWFSIAPVDDSLLPFYAHITPEVYINNKAYGIEWCDAIYAATTLSRGNNSCLATTDSRLRQLPELHGRIAC